MHVLIVGCGYVGEQVAAHLLSQGQQVTALTRSAQHAQAWQQRGIVPVLGDVLAPDSLKLLPSADVCLYAVGYDRNAAASKADVYVQGVSNVLQEIHHRVSRMVYISSSSVYGQSQGEWVDENSLCEPTSTGGQICLQAESEVRQAYQSAATILRLSGIYGPGRLLGRKEQLLKQTPFTGNPEAWLNLIHRDDITQAISLLLRHPPPSTLYLLSDESPISRREFYTQLAQALDTPSPIFEPSDESTLNKRCNSERIRHELSLTLKFPTIKSGLPAAVGN